VTVVAVKAGVLLLVEGALSVGVGARVSSDEVAVTEHFGVLFGFSIKRLLLKPLNAV
jgi:hypothetical protein